MKRERGEGEREREGNSEITYIIPPHIATGYMRHD